jgi:hypothetical protein
MKPLASDEDRKTTVAIFANGCYDGTIKITDFHPMLTYLNGHHIKILYEKLPKTEEHRIYTTSGEYYDSRSAQHYNAYYSYSASDAELYLEWLISVVRGSEKVSEDTISEAYNQLDKFILALRDVTGYNKPVILMKPYDWVQRLAQFEKDTSETIKSEVTKITDMLEEWDYTIRGYDETLQKICKTLDERTKSMVEPLEQILTWMKKYSPTLDALENEYSNIIGKKGKP